MGNVRIKIDNQDFETDFTHRNNIFDVNARRKTENIQKLKEYVYKECEKSWTQLPKHLATMKRRYLQELCEALS